MAKTFAIADLHGRFDLLVAALSRIFSIEDRGTIVFLGDYVDRGPQSRQIMEMLMAGPKSTAWNWVCLKGNHEDMMVSCLGGAQDIGWWLGNGGEATLASYGGTVPQAHLDWCRSLPLLHSDGHRVFVHAAVDPSLALREQSEKVLLWTRYPPRAEIHYPGLHIVHGHTPNPRGPEFYEGRTNLDTYAVGTGRLVVGVFDDNRSGGPVSTLEIVAAPG